MLTKILLQVYFITTVLSLIFAKDNGYLWDFLQSFVGDLADEVPQLSSPVDQELYRELLLNTKETCEKFGYPVEVHNVTTVDGYFLTLFRITKGKKGYPLLLQHGFIASSQFFVDNTEHSLAFFLADNGYDVWMGNFRGNRYTSHKKYSRTQKEFWDFTWDELADYDIPAMIDYILLVTSKTKLLYIGHAMGTTSMFSLLATQENYHDKIVGFIALGPVARLHYTPSFFRNGETIQKIFLPIYKLFGFHTISKLPTKMSKLGQHFCPANDTIICGTTLDFLGGYNPYLRNKTRNFVALFHENEGASFSNFHHYSQLIRKKEFSRYDYGSFRNLLKYSAISPPVYDLKKIQLPIAIIYGANDVWSNTIDVALMLRNLPNVVGVKIIDFPMFNHFDIAYAINAEKLFYKDLLLYLEKMMK